MMQPHLADKIAKQTKQHFPDGIPAFGTDALRFTFAALASTGRDIRFDLNRIEGYRNFCNKLWNAARFVAMQTEGKDVGLNNSEVELSLADRWIISRLQTTETEVVDHIEHYRFDLAAKEMYEFTWHQYCDWYLELTKPVLNSDKSSAAAKRGTRRTLVRVLETLLRLMHPIMPYITEEIWQNIKPLTGETGDSLMLVAYPHADNSQIDQAANSDMQWLQSFISSIRQIRSEMDIKPKVRINILMQNWTEADQQKFANTALFINALAKVDTVTWLDKTASAPESATALVGELKILIPLAGLIDTAAETARLHKEIDKKQKGIQGLEARLNNPNFTNKAPEAVVNQVKQQYAAQRAAITQLQQQLEKIQTV